MSPAGRGSWRRFCARPDAQDAGYVVDLDHVDLALRGHVEDLVAGRELVLLLRESQRVDEGLLVRHRPG
jgi:hypothetical protein